MSSRTLQTFIVMVATIATAAATAIFLPSLPSLAIYFQTSNDLTQLAVPLALFGAFVATPIVGSLSDHYGRLPVMMGGMLVFLIGTAACIFSPTLPFFLIARFIQGCGGATSFIVGWALIPDIYPKDESTKIITWMGAGISVSPVLAPVIGGYLQDLWGWQASFILILTLIVIIIGLLFCVPSSSEKNTPRGTLPLLDLLKNYVEILQHRNFLIYSSLFSLLACGEWCYLTMIPFYFEKTLFLLPSVFGIYLAGSAAFKIVGTFLTPMLLKSIGDTKTIKIGIFFTLIGSLSLLLISFFAPTSPLFIVGSFGLYIFGGALLWGPSTAKALQHFEKSRGAASAVRGLLMTLFFTLGGFAGSFLNDGSLILLASFLCAMAFSCWFAFSNLDNS